MGTYVFDFFDGKIGVCGDADCVWPDIDNDHDWTCDELLEEIVDLLVRGAQFWASMIPSDHAFFGYKGGEPRLWGRGDLNYRSLF